MIDREGATPRRLDCDGPVPKASDLADRVAAPVAQYILVGEDEDGLAVAYPVDTEDQVDAATQARREFGEARASIWHGDPDDPDSYRDSVHVLSAAADGATGPTTVSGACDIRAEVAACIDAARRQGRAVDAEDELTAEDLASVCSRPRPAPDAQRVG